MRSATTFDLQELDKYITEKCGGKEFYLGCWSPNEHQFKTTKAPKHMEVFQGNNWIAIRNGAEQSKGILFPSQNDEPQELVVFRGYLAEASIHSYSDPKQVRKYWSEELSKRHNGVFSAVLISDNGKKLSIVTDLFGMSPIYVRREGELVFFSSTAALLSFKDDEPDKMSVVMRLLSGYIPGRCSLSEKIELAEEASVTTYSSRGHSVQKWYDYETFPKTTQTVDERSLELSEQKLSTAVNRCQKMQFGETILPLSSGYDSRRLFAHLEKSDVPLKICTVQTLLEGGEDVEAKCAVQIAQDFNVEYKVFNLPMPEEWYSQETHRIFSMDGQCQDHTWSALVFDYYRNTDCSFYDGTGGDIFGFNDWVFEGHLDKTIPNSFPSVLNQALFPKIKEIRRKLFEWKAHVPTGPNENMITFALWQTRRSSIAWSQQQARPGQLVFYPYFDLDYIETMLIYANEKYVVNRPQKLILYKYWPDLAKYLGTREMPEKSRNLLSRRIENNRHSQKKLIVEALALKNNKFEILSLFSFAARCLIHISQFLTLKIIPNWWLRPTAEIVFWWNSRPYVIQNEKEKGK